jgi:hypothetical protein
VSTCTVAAMAPLEVIFFGEDKKILLIVKILAFHQGVRIEIFD